MPQFHSMMVQRLRSPEQGADTVAWLALSKAAGGTHSGKFFQGGGATLAWRCPPFPFSSHYKKFNGLCRRSEGRPNPPASCLDSQFYSGGSDFHLSAGDAGQSCAGKADSSAEGSSCITLDHSNQLNQVTRNETHFGVAYLKYGSILKTPTQTLYPYCRDFILELE